MEEVRENFATAAEFMQRCGYDGVMVFAGHGWLLHQFLSPRTNTRNDQYGGSLENRARFPLSVIRAVRERCGRDFMIEVRVSGSEREPGGLEVEEVAQFCKMLEGLVDLVHVSVGIYHDPIRTREFSCWTRWRRTSPYTPAPPARKSALTASPRCKRTAPSWSSTPIP